MITILIALFLLALLVPMAMAGSSLAPWLPSHDEDVEAALDLADARSGEVFYDLGCGEGHALFVAARRGLIAKGIELAPILYFIAKARAAFARQTPPGKVEVIFGDLFKKDISDADIIFVYGLPHALRGPFAAKLEREAKPGVRVVSCGIHIRAWQEKETGHSATRNTPLYLYDVPRA